MVEMINQTEKVEGIIFDFSPSLRWLCQPSTSLFNRSNSLSMPQFLGGQVLLLMQYYVLFCDHGPQFTRWGKSLVGGYRS